MEMKNFIQKYNDIIDHELCDQIIKEADENHFKSATTGDGNVSDYRNCIAKPLSDKFDKSIFEVVAKSLRKYCETFKWCEFGLNIEDTGYQHLFYKGSNRGEYKMHTDHFDLHPRVLSCSMLLNDNYDGGDFVFFDEQYLVKKKKGSVIMFPSNFCFPHAVTPVTNGDRHSIITWIR